MDIIITASILGISIIFIIFFVMWHVKGSRWNGPPLPPGPIGLPIVGYLPFLGPNLLHQFTELGHKYGPILKFYLGSKLCIVIGSPSLAKELLRDKDAVFCDRDVPIAITVSTFGGNGIVWTKHSDPQWRALRKVFVQELMSSKRLDASYDIRRNEVRKVVRDVYAAAGKPVPVGKLSFLCATNLMMNMVWGDTVDGEERLRICAEFSLLIGKVFYLAGVPDVSDFFPSLSVFDFQGVKKMMKNVVRSLDMILDGVISKKKENDDEGKKDFLQLLLKFMEKPNSEISLTLPQIKAVIMDIMAGGTDTTSSTTEWAMAELINNPTTMAKAQNELNDVVGLNNIVEESHIPKLKYLEAVIKEALRLHPVAPILVPRTPTRPDSTLGGYSIPKNTRIIVNVWSIHRNPSLWYKPSEFKPERFLQHTNDFDVNEFQYIPFGWGRRSCPGKPLGDRMVTFLLASLLHSFDWRMAQGEKLDMSETFGITLNKTTPLLAIPTPRLLNSDLYL